MNLHGCRAYQVSVDLVTEAASWTRGLPRGYGWLADQTRRSAGSIPLNTAEGLGRPSRAERRRFFEIAIGSAHELAACLEVDHRLGLLPEARFRALWDACDHVTRMLGKLIGATRRGYSLMCIRFAPVQRPVSQSIVKRQPLIRGSPSATSKTCGIPVRNFPRTGSTERPRTES